VRFRLLQDRRDLRAAAAQGPTVVLVDVSGLGGRAPSAAFAAHGQRVQTPSTELAATSAGPAFETLDDARSISEPPGLTFSRAGLSPGRTSRFVADL
jgi:hypothetical protein